MKKIIALLFVAGLAASWSFAHEGKGTPTPGTKTGTASTCSYAGQGCTWYWQQPNTCPPPDQTACYEITFVWTTQSTCVADPTGGGGYMCQ